MISVDKVYGATVQNQALTFACQNLLSLVNTQDAPAGQLIDVYSLAFEILDANYTMVTARASVNLTTGHLGTGRYAATWAPGSAAAGQFFVRWYYKVLSTDNEKQFDQEFELTALPYKPLQRHYAAVYDLVERGFPSTFTAAQTQRAIERASALVELYTGRGPGAFDPIYKTIEVNGSSARALLLGEPICAIEQVLLSLISPFRESDLSIVSQALRIYNRHLTNNLFSPDDRNSPKLEFIHGDDLNGVNFDIERQSIFRLDSLIWPRGQKNVQIKGIFGYTDPDGSFVGSTPSMLREATILLALRNFSSTCAEDRQANQRQSRITQENTRDQGFQYAQPWLKGFLTGDAEIDQILASYIRPPVFGAA